MHLVSFFVAIIICCHLAKSQFDSGMSGDRRVIVQLFEWPFQDIEEECKNVLGPQKFGAVLVSSVTENLAIRLQSKGKIMRPWYERYQPISWKIFSRLGTEQQFKQMVEECNKNSVRVYVDAVFNHGVGTDQATTTGEVVGVAGTTANVKTKNYPGLGYSEENFHKSCPMDFKNSTALRICELAGLQDVNQTQPYVQDKIITFLNKLIDYGVAGFRIDAAKHMWPDDLRYIYSQLKNVTLNEGKANMRPLWMLENFDDEGDYQEDYMDIGSEYDFLSQKMVTDTFKSGTRTFLSIYNYAKNPVYLSKPLQDFGTNHDLQRWHWDKGFWEAPDHSGIQQVINAFFLTFSRGTPNIFSGYSYTETAAGPPSDNLENIISAKNCTDGWMCEHRFGPLQWVIKYFTNFVQDEPIESWWSNWEGGSPLQAAFTRGQKSFAVFNADTQTLNYTFKVPLSPGIYCDLATGFFCQHHQMCKGKGGMRRQVEVKKDGSIDVHLPGIIRPGSHDVRVGDMMPEPPYLVISAQSMYPSGSSPLAGSCLVSLLSLLFIWVLGSF